MKVRKRDGKVVEFDKQKIINAISRAGFVRRDTKEKIADYIANLGINEITVEQIQDIVEEKLMASAYKEVAKEYINYRYLHNLSRQKYQEIMDTVAEKLGAKDVQNQNANVDEYSFGGRVGEMSDAIMKKYALDYIVSKKTKENHLNNEVYIHDLGAYAVGSHNCLSLPLDELLANGFNTRQTDIRPANSVNTAMQLVAVLMQVQSLSQFGGISATHLDWTMIPYVRKSFYKHFRTGCYYMGTYELFLDKAEDVSIEDDVYKKCNPKAYIYAMDMTIREIKQSCEGLYHNLKFWATQQ